MTSAFLLYSFSVTGVNAIHLFSCTQNNGITHFMIEGRKQAIPYMFAGRNALNFHQVDLSPVQPERSPADAEDADGSVLKTEHLPLAALEDHALLARNLRRFEDNASSEVGPSIAIRQAAADRVIAAYQGFRPLRGGEVIYSAPDEAKHHVDFLCFADNSDGLESSVSGGGDRREGTDNQILDSALLPQLMKKLFCDNKEVCPYSSSEESIAFAMNYVRAQCESSRMKRVSIQIVS
jgi:hypothetical protein